MALEDDTRRVVEGYFNAWTNDRPDEAFGFLAPDLRFGGPTAAYDSAEAFRPALNAFASMTKSARVAELIVDGARAAMLYDCDLPAPVGTLRIASFFTVRDGKIAAYDTRFDATELRRLLASR
jgi:hypothetical protein